ncbi:MAG: 30S ribosomal protein S6 [Phycisphaerae bacterium]|nr:30S ribosomal protein S6 [Phycisphaerae bacterium]
MEQTMHSYEGMFLLDVGQGSIETAGEPIREVLARSEAEILAIKPWEDRKLAYEINGRKRGLYFLAYFKMDTEKVRELERDCQLREEILRILVIRKDSISDEEINADTPAMLVERASVEAAAAAESTNEAAAEAPAAEESTDEAPAAVESAEEAPVAEEPAEEAPVVEESTDEVPAEITETDQPAAE